MDDFREGVKRVGGKALTIMEAFLDGTLKEPEKVAQASKMVGAAIKIEHMNQVKDYNQKSLALRLMKHLPMDEETRVTYIALTNPQLRPLLLSRPEKEGTD